MKNVLAAGALAATLLAGSALPSFASTTYSDDLGAFSSSDTAGFGRPRANKATGSFTDYYTFSLENVATLARGTITNSFTSMSQFIQNFTVTLFSGNVGSGVEIASASINSGDSGPVAPKYNDSETASVKGVNLGVGNYYLEVTGKTGSASYVGSLAISAVPLPSTVALFGVALAGLGVAGAMRRKSASAAV